MASPSSNTKIRLDVDELVLMDDEAAVGDTFIFEPAASEAALGTFFATIETEDAGGVGRELIDMVIQALQREYYRDPGRGRLASFESALHQGNLVLHDVAEQGVRDWMRSFHVALGILADEMLHISTAGDGVVLLARSGRITDAAEGLSHSPVTDPLRTFSQVASGTVAHQDVLFLGTANFTELYSSQDLVRLVADHAAGTISVRLQQLYEDQRKRLPVAALIVSAVPAHVAKPAGHSAILPSSDRKPIGATSLKPREPLTIHSSLIKRLVILAGRLLSQGWRVFRGVVWPKMKSVSQTAGHTVRQQTSQQLQRMRDRGSGERETSARVLPWRRLMPWARERLRSLPVSSKVFAVVAVLLAISLVASLVLLQRKRAADLQIQQASELLHEARTKKEAASTALIYDNRDQARMLLGDAEEIADRIAAMGLYQEQVEELTNSITTVQDRLDKVTRVVPASLEVVGDFAAQLTSAAPTHLFFVDGSLYSFDPQNNTIVKMTADGEATVASNSTQGVGFFTSGIAHEADKSIVFITDGPGMALYDTKTDLLQKQEIDWPSENVQALSLATYGSRLYVYDQSANNVFGFSKTLRGYSGGTPWITDEEVPRDNVTSIGVDGYIYTMHTDGTVRKLLRGAPVEFALEAVQPPIPGSASMLITEDLRHLYVFDKEQKRVIVFDTKGNLNRQIFLGDDVAPAAIAVDPEETKLYVLDGTRVVAVSLRD